MKLPQPNTVGAYLLGLVATVLGVGLRVALVPLIGVEAPYLTILPVVALVAVFGGTGPGVLSAVVGVAAAEFWLVEPHDATLAGRDLWRAVFVVGVAVAAGVLTERTRASRRRDAEENLALRLAEEGRRLSDERFRALVDSTFEGVVFSREGIIVDCNDQFALLLGYDREALLGRPIVELIFADDLPRVMADIEANRESVKQHRLVRRGGDPVWVEAHGRPAIHLGQEARVTALRDIDDARRAAEELRQAHALAERRLAELQVIYDHAPVGLCVLDTDFRWVRINQRLAEINGFPPEVHIGRSVRELLPVIADQAEATVRRVMESGRAVRDIEFVGETPAAPGVTRTWLEHFYPLPDANGKVIGINVVCEEVTERRIAERALRQSEARLRAFVESNVIGILFGDADGQVNDCNEELARIIGRSRDDVRAGKVRWTEITPPEDLPLDAAAIAQARRTGRCEPYEKHYLRPDGTAVPVVVGFTLLEPDRQQSVAFILDVSRQKELEAELHRQRRELELKNQQLEGLFDHAPAGFALFDAAEPFAVLTHNTVYQRIWPEPYRSQGLRGKTLADYLPLAEGSGIINVFREVARSGQGRTLYDFAYDGLPQGRTWWNWTLAPIAHEGRVVALAFMAIDVSREVRVREEWEKARRATEAAANAKSQFLANVSHELRTPMNAILGMTELALSEELSEHVRENLLTVKESADVLLTLLNEILDFSRLEAGRFTLDPAPFNLRAMIGETIRSLSVKAREKRLQLVSRIADDVPENVVGDRIRLRQVLVNLIGNAIKFTDEGEVSIEVGVASRSTSEVELEFAVADTGIGIHQHDHLRIFAPFAQADDSMTRGYGGAGLGLAISASIVNLMRGMMSVESEPGRGSIFCFAVRLPLADDAPRPPAEPALAPVAPVAPARRPLRVLVAEDTRANQQLVLRILGRRGHSVEVAANGREAVEAVEKGHFDVVLMDVQMPLVDGFEATAAIRRLSGPAACIPIIAMTAHAMKGDQERCLAAGMDHYLAKPVQAADLIAAVEEAADRR